MLMLDRQTLKRIIEESYERGWSGFLELKSDYAESVLDEISKTHEKFNSTITSSLTMTTDSQYSVSFGDSAPTFMPGYYSYVGHNAHGTTFVDEPGEDVI